MLCLCMFHSYLTCFIPDGTININNETIGGFKGGFQKMLSFLKLVFGSDITETEYRYADNMPYYIHDGYTPQLLIWGAKPMYHFDTKGSFQAAACIKEATKEVSGTLYNSLYIGSGKFNCATKTELDRKSHSFHFYVPAGISSVLGTLLP